MAGERDEGVGVVDGERMEGSIERDRKPHLLLKTSPRRYARERATKRTESRKNLV